MSHDRKNQTFRRRRSTLLVEKDSDEYYAFVKAWLTQWNRGQKMLEYISKQDKDNVDYEDLAAVWFKINKIDLRMDYKTEREYLAKRFLLQGIDIGPDRNAENHKEKMKNCFKELRNVVKKKEENRQEMERNKIIMQNVHKELKEKIRQMMLDDIKKLKQLEEEQKALWVHKNYMKPLLSEMKEKVQIRKEFMKGIFERQKWMAVVHTELKNLFTIKRAIKRKIVTMHAIHMELLRVVEEKRECNELYVPRRLFLFPVEDMLPIPKNVTSPEPPAHSCLPTTLPPTEIPPSVLELTPTNSSKIETTSPRTRTNRTFKQRILRFFGF